MLLVPTGISSLQIKPPGKGRVTEKGQDLQCQRVIPKHPPLCCTPRRSQLPKSLLPPIFFCFFQPFPDAADTMQTSASPGLAADPALAMTNSWLIQGKSPTAQNAEPWQSLCSQPHFLSRKASPGPAWCEHLRGRGGNG